VGMRVLGHLAKVCSTCVKPIWRKRWIRRRVHVYAPFRSLDLDRPCRMAVIMTALYPRLKHTHTHTLRDFLAFRYREQVVTVVTVVDVSS
jgi:hypothetical protein